MKRLLPVLMGFVVLMLSSTEGWSLPRCPGSPMNSFSTVLSWTDCFGIWTISSGDRAGYKYVGEFRNGKSHGQGTATYASGSKYVGEWKDGKKHGQGTQTYAPGHKYVGQWKNGKRHGQGTFFFADGRKYVGEWKDGKRHGQGTQTYARGSKYVGEWKRGNLNGQGTYTHANGEKHDGEFRDGLPNGLGIHTYADGRIEEGIWKNGKFKYAQKVTPSVTAKKSPEPQVKTKPKPPPKSATSGSGFFISKLGHVITNEHVVNKCESVTVGDNANKQVIAQVIETDRRNDLALLIISSMEMASAKTKSLVAKLGLTVTPLASQGLLRPNAVELGEYVMVAGFPFADIISNTVKVTWGIVSAKRGMGDDSGQFQILAAVQKGSSGGPIYDENGNIIGVVVAQLNKLKVARNYGSSLENVNFGIKASTIKQFLNSSGLPSSWSKRSKRMSTKEIAKIAENQTVMVVCHH
jgi:S1-C subfamily serine protease